MLLAIDDYVYVPSLGMYGRIVDIYGREETFYTVSFSWDFKEEMDFEESNLVKLESPYFPKGSIITGLKGAKMYNFTNDKAIMEVIDNENVGRMLVKILKHKDKPYLLYEEYWVDSIWFKLVRPRTNFYRGEKGD